MDNDWTRICCAFPTQWNIYLFQYLENTMLHKAVPLATWKAKMKRLRQLSDEDREEVQSRLREEFKCEFHLLLNICSSSKCSMRRLRRLVQYANVSHEERDELWNTRLRIQRDIDSEPSDWEEDREDKDGHD